MIASSPKKKSGCLAPWLERRKDTQIPEIAKARNLFQRIVSDQRVTADEIAELESLVESIGRELERRPVLDELPDLPGDMHSELGAAAKKLSSRKKTSFAAINLQEGSVKLGGVTWNWRQLFKQISTPLTASTKPGDCYKCDGLGVILLSTTRESCWQCGGTGSYAQNQTRTTIEEILDRDNMS